MKTIFWPARIFSRQANAARLLQPLIRPLHSTNWKVKALENLIVLEGHHRMFSPFSTNGFPSPFRIRENRFFTASVCTSATDSAADPDNYFIDVDGFSTSTSSAGLTKTALRKMKIAQLREELAGRGMDTTGKKAELLGRLLEFLEQEEATFIQAISKEQLQETKQKSRAPLDPDHTYVIRLRSATTGRNRVVEGIGIGMTILVMDVGVKDWNQEVANSIHPDSQLTVVESNQILLPGSRTGFEADYCALIMALQEAKQRGIQNCIIELDDVGIIRQLEGQGRVGSGYQQNLYKTSLELTQQFKNCEIRTHAPGTKDSAEASIRAKTALAEQRVLKSDWEMVDPITEQPARSSSDDETQASFDPQREYLLQFDGGARGNPTGIAGAGMAIYDGNEEVWCGWKFLGKDVTNNVAEYTSLIEGLRCAKDLGICRIRAEGDSELIVKQVLGQYKIKSPGLIPLHKEVKQLVNSFDSFGISYIPRGENQRADYLANHAMDVQTSSLS